MPTLFEISDDLRALDQLLYESGGDITDPEVEQAISEWMESLDEDLTTKVDNYAALITEIEARAEARKKEADRLRDRAKVDANAAKSLKERLQFVFEQRGLGKLECPRYVVGLRKHGGKLPVEVDDVPAEELAPQYQRVRVDVDKNAIREALEKGEQLSFARLGERGQSLSIR